MTRIFYLILVGILTFFIVRYLVGPKKQYKKCEKCEGIGYWFNAHEQITCDNCGGSGKVKANLF